VPLQGLGSREVLRKRRTRFHRDDRALVLPNALKERGDQLPTLGGRRLDLPEAAEVGE
jgi:hypothetical protein